MDEIKKLLRPGFYILSLSKTGLGEVLFKTFLEGERGRVLMIYENLGFDRNLVGDAFDSLNAEILK